MSIKKIDLDWLVRLIPDAALLVGEDQIIVAANPLACLLFRSGEQSMKGRMLEELIPIASRQRHEQYVKYFFRNESPRSMGSGLRFQGMCLDNSVLPLDIMINKVSIDNVDFSLAVVRDDSERIEAQRMRDELKIANARMLRAEQVGGMGWWELSNDGRKLTWSSMLPKILGLPQDVEPSLKLIVEKCYSEDRQALEAVYEGLLNLTEDALTYRIVDPGGKLRWIQETIQQAPCNRLLSVIRDVTDEKMLQEKLRLESVLDGLTGLYNRKQFNIDLAGCFSEFLRAGRTSAVVMYDFDRFKKINDCFGHIAGDYVLKESAQVVMNQLRPSDIAYRIGGEEFAIILPGAGIEGALQLAERVRLSIQEKNFTLKYADIKATISMGISIFLPDDIDSESIQRRADEGLYKSKSRSRNTSSVVA